MKKVFLWSLVVVMVISMVAMFSITGCKTTITTTETTAAAEPVTISYITWDDYTPEMLDLFKKQTGITLNYENVEDTVYSDTLKTKIAGGADLDVFAVEAAMRGNVFNDDTMLDLTGQPVLERIRDLTSTTSADGKIYGIPIGGFVEGVWYNKDIFATNNLSVPKNWVEFNDVCKKLKEAGISPLVEAFKGTGWTMWLGGIGPLQRIYENDPKMVAKLASGEVKWTDKIWVDALKEVESFIKIGYFDPASTGLDYMQAVQYFNDGKAAMSINGSWNANNGTHGIELRKFDLGFFALPYNLPGEELKGIRVSGLATGIAAKSTKKDAAIKFLEWITDPNGGATIYHNTNGRPSNIKNFDTDLGIFTDIIKDAQGLPGVETLRCDVPLLVNTTLFTVMSEIISGTTTVEQAAKDLQDAQDKSK